MALPLLGGAPAVWNTALTFFQAALLAGYAYAHLSLKYLGIRVQMVIHLALFAAVVLCLPVVLPSGLEPNPNQHPALWLLSLMAVTVGPPFFIVASTAPLLQRWLSKTDLPSAADPYFLYAASNAGSMLALVTFPFLLEPNFSLLQLSDYWVVAYLALGLLLALCASFTWSHLRPESIVMESDIEEAPAAPRRWLWVLLGFVPCSLMIGFTNYVTSDIAAVPLLWVIPLAIYLLSFILAFARRQVVPYKFWAGLAAITITMQVASSALEITKPPWVVMLSGALCLLSVSMVCHGRLAKDRPGPRYLTGYYLYLSFGGVLGGIFCSLIAPAVFSYVYEYGLTLLLAGLLLPGVKPEGNVRSTIAFVAPVVAAVLSVIGFKIAVRRFNTEGMQHLVSALPPCLIALAMVPFRYVFALSLVGFWAYGIYNQRGVSALIYESRSFFGMLRVLRLYEGQVHALSHGTTAHGNQSRDPVLSRVPGSYYYPTGPVGQVFQDRKAGPPRKVALVGLGAGSLAAYARKGDIFRFFEIDPDVVSVARNPKYFTYLRDAKGQIEVVLGDARLELQKDKDLYDLIILDAYSGDAVPVHLLTKEAVGLYLRHLRPGGLICFHISNRYLRLAPVVARISESLNLVSYHQSDLIVSLMERMEGKSVSQWIMTGRRPEDFGKLLSSDKWVEAELDPSVGLWTDDYSSLIPVLTGL